VPPSVAPSDATTLFCPVAHSLFSTRCAVSLKPDLFEGLRFDLTKPLNHNFALSHSIFMGNIDVPTANNQVHAFGKRSSCMAATFSCMAAAVQPVA
jgi:mitochondrial import receptor subunit TOM40